MVSPLLLMMGEIFVGRLLKRFVGKKFEEGDANLITTSVRNILDELLDGKDIDEQQDLIEFLEYDELEALIDSGSLANVPIAYKPLIKRLQRITGELRD